MNNLFTQKKIKDFLEANPYNTKVEVGSVEDLNGQDYIILNYSRDTIIGFNNKGIYTTLTTFTVCTKDFDKRKSLVEYIKSRFNVEVEYEPANDYQYYVATCTTYITLCPN